MFRDVHVSGHPRREDIRDTMQIINPQHVIPAHAGIDKTKYMAELVDEMGYKLHKTCHLMEDGGILKL